MKDSIEFENGRQEVIQRMLHLTNCDIRLIDDFISGKEKGCAYTIETLNGLKIAYTATKVRLESLNEKNTKPELLADANVNE